jgi:hypothetical protein
MFRVGPVVAVTIAAGYFVTNSTFPLIFAATLFAAACSPSLSFGQSFEVVSESVSGESVSVAPQPPPLSPPAESKRILGIIPNNRTWPSLTNYQPLTTKQKFKLAQEDSFDRGTVMLAAMFAADAQVTNANRSFGQGMKGYAQYFGASYTDFVVGNYMSEAIYPALLHQDPRYFRRGVGSTWSRLGYSIGQIFWTHTDSDRTQFNYSEILGNSTAVAISNLYYQDNRSIGNSTTKLGMQIGVDMASNVLKEFWPDVSRKFRKHSQ